MNISGTDVANELVIDSYGRILVAGSSGGGADFAIMRLKASDGSLDSSFGTSGKQTVDFGGSEGVQGMVVDADGRIVLVGGSSASLAVARLHGGGARHYVLQDANYNVTAVAEASGKVVDRYQYTPYGERTTLNANFSTDFDGNGEVNQAFFFQGLRADGNSGNHHARNRDYRATLGRWTQSDPEGYIDGMSLYSPLQLNPLRYNDPWGTSISKTGVSTHPELKAGEAQLHPLKGKNGSWFFVLAGQAGAEGHWGVSMEIAYSANSDNCDCDSIKLLQFARSTSGEFGDMQLVKHRDWQTTRGWLLDAQKGSTAPWYNDSYGDTRESGSTKPGKKPVPARLDDWPGTKKAPTSNYRYQFITLAVCVEGKDSGKVYDAVNWGFVMTKESKVYFDLRGPGAPTSTAPVPAQLQDPVIDEAIGKWNEHQGVDKVPPLQY